MNQVSKIQNNLFQNYTVEEFLEKSLEIFNFQYQNNAIYRQFCDGVKKTPSQVNTLPEIPFMPISFFKHHAVKTGDFNEVVVFESSGTVSEYASKHYVKDLELYKTSFLKSFEHFYGALQNYQILPLLPSYLERSGSSLIYMIDTMMQCSGQTDCSYYLYNHEDLFQRLQVLKTSSKKTILFGVSFALLDFAEHYTLDFPELIVFETGGMKGRRQELLKSELHERLKQAFRVPQIHSEYGMTELLSQSYSAGENLFFSPPWQKILIRDQRNPLHVLSTDLRGGINVIDFANLYSCSFIATEDLGITYPDNSFEILGRIDRAEMRGCNLMV